MEVLYKDADKHSKYPLFNMKYIHFNVVFNQEMKLFQLRQNCLDVKKIEFVIPAGSLFTNADHAPGYLSRLSDVLVPLDVNKLCVGTAQGGGSQLKNLPQSFTGPGLDPALPASRPLWCSVSSLDVLGLSKFKP